MGCGAAKPAGAVEEPAPAERAKEAAAAAPAPAAQTPEQAGFAAQLEQCRCVHAGLMQMAQMAAAK